MVSLESAISASASASVLVALGGLEEGAIAAGLPAGTAQAFACQALKGSTLVMMRDGGSPAGLKDKVSSPGGTTIAGLGVLEDAAVRGSFMRVVQAAANTADKGNAR